MDLHLFPFFPLFPEPARPAGKSKLQIKVCVELWRPCVLPSVALVNQRRMDCGSVWYSCLARPPWLMHSPSWDPSKNGPNGCNASHASSWIFHAAVCHIILTPCNLSSSRTCAISAALAVNDCSGEHTVTSGCMRNCTSGFPTNPACRFRFHPTVWDHKPNNLAGAASEGKYKQKVCIYTGLLTKKKEGRMRKNRLDVQHPVKKIANESKVHGQEGACCG